MHILATTTARLDDLIEPVDLAQTPGDVVALSFSDSDLRALAAAWAEERESLPSHRFASLRDLRHPLSVDLWLDRVACRAKVILVRLLGGLDWWRYGVERLNALACEQGIALALLPGDDREDPRLAEASTLPAAELAELTAYFREGGRENLRALLRRLARHAGVPLQAPPPRPLPRAAGYLPGEGAVPLERLLASLPPGRPVVPLVFYRSLLLAEDVAPVDALAAALAAQGLAPAPLLVASLKEPDSAAFVEQALAVLRPAAIVTTTAFAAGAEPGAPTVLDGPGVPVLQAVFATTRRAAWQESARGLGAADLAMHVVLPELDGRVLAGAAAFKDLSPAEAELGFTGLHNQPEPDRIAQVARRVAALVRLGATPRGERRVAVLLPDYPGAQGRSGYAVGLDVPQSAVELLRDLRDAGYDVEKAPETSRSLLDSLVGHSSRSEAESRDPPETQGADGAWPLSGSRISADALSGMTIERYEELLSTLPPSATAAVRAAWGDPAGDPDVVDGSFRFRAAAFGKALVALPPDRGRSLDRRADYHDPALPPRHALLAFGLWLQHEAQVHALVHLGAHGTLEWLPGKVVALSAACFPEALVGALPVFYPFIVSNPGEAAQAKRRLAAVTLGHLPPPLVQGELSEAARELERLVDEYAMAEGLDPRRRERLAKLIVESAERSGLAAEAGVAARANPDEALVRIDNWLCDLKDLAIKDGLHVYGRAPAGAEPLWAASAEAERAALLTALDGKRVAPGPAGAPARGRRDVLPTGRNLFAADPRALPTPTAMDLGRQAADEVIRRYLQEHGEMPRALLLDLWGSATLRTGGEEIAQGLALLGCRPTWDPTTGRVTGIEVLPPAAVRRPRVDVTWRISGLFRDLFAEQIALLDMAVRAVAERDETDEENPLAAARRRAEREGPAALARVFGSAPGVYGAGIEERLASGDYETRDELGAAYLEAGAYAYSAADKAERQPQAFAERVAASDLLVHGGDDPGRDLLEGSADVGYAGGFAAAAASLGRKPTLVMLDTSDPNRPRARRLDEALARIVRARAVSPRFIAGLLRHGPRGAAELAETVDRLVGFAETTDAVPGRLLDLVHEAYVLDPQVRDFLLRENPAAARAIAERLAAARRRGLWHSRRNAVDADLEALAREARG